ncbi:glycosyltransferase family A protein [Knoellia subterranea]|uniref:Glycosyltransferase 2-like domain-containing protein n=1 Tax=Knoellia subterranea KCTC 19937 TaxID=1385521 RepID=A0A0A0JJ51_9MICO|nr:glycosyltransferase family A protein [Knoellia subterranea]KGN35691.1 hypothetical protein N803_06370 [Knoellia subterranea KCTC 19937]
MNTGLSVSVILLPDGWSDTLLRATIDNLRRALGSVQGEIILASRDHSGLEEPSWIEAAALDTGCLFVPSVARTRAGTFNSAAAVAGGEFLLIADEDWFFPDGAVAAALESLTSRDGSHAGVFERRDVAGAQDLTLLVESISASSMRYVESTPRPRWNRGMAMLCRADLFVRLRGLDEREAFDSHVGWDLCVRLGRAAETIEWFAEPQLTAYHALGGTCPDPARHGPEGDHHRRNRVALLEEDPSIYRNLIDWSVPRELRRPLVSVCIATRDRGDYIAESIKSVLAQTFADFEVIVVDDGSTDTTREAVAAIQDPRVRYVFQSPSGISAARNRGADESRGFFTAVHDDDDLMLPWRLEAGLAALNKDVDATFGAWVNFDDETAAMVLHATREAFTQELLAFNGMGPGHATWLLPTALVRRVRYDETLSAAVDINLASRLMWNGVRWTHTGKVHFIRRIHHRQVTAVDGGRQRSAALLTRYAAILPAAASGRRSLRKAAGEIKPPAIKEKADLFRSFGVYLPDHLVRRTGLIVNNATNKIIALDRYDAVSYMLAEHDLMTGKLRFEFSEVDEFTWDDIVRMRDAGLVGIQLGAVRRHGPPPSTAGEAEAEGLPQPRRAAAAIERRLGDLMTDLDKRGKSPAWLINPSGDLTEREIALLGEPARAVRLSAASEGGGRVRMDAVGYPFWSQALRAMRQLRPCLESGRLVYLDSEARDWRTLIDALTGEEGI